MQDIAIFTGGFLAFVTMMGIVGRWLISQYFTGQQQIQDMKETSMRQAIERIESIAMSAKDVSRNLELSLSQHSQRLLSIETRLSETVGAYAEQMHSFTGIAEEVLAFINKPSDKTEAIKIGGDLYLLRKKQDGS